ncbi:MAG: LapA family protein [Parvularculaceae bacterium]|nr:LapA family protein [Parvularculaceae bacterium]
MKNLDKLVGWLLWFPLGLVVVWFLVANRQPVALSFDAVSVENPSVATPPLPLWVWLTLALLLGFVLGAVGMWASGRQSRRRARADSLELMALKRDREGAAAGSVPTIDAL